MFGWRKKNDGFDWHAYVRTTIKVRREARRERVDAARQAALDKAHAAGHAVVDGGKAAGRAAARGARDGAVQGAKGFSWVWQQTARLFRVVFGQPGAWLMQTTAHLGDKLKAWDIAGPLALVGSIALLSGAMKWNASGLNADTAVPLGLGALLLVLAAPALLGRAGLASPRTSLRYGAAGLAALALGAGAYGLQKNGAPGVPSLGSLSKITLLPKSAPPVEGRASVVAADTLRVNGALYRLTGIDAPEKSQSCMKDGKRRWRCGEAAVAALEKRARSKVVRCTPSAAADGEGRVPATCTVDGADIAAELVRGGHVFAASTMFGGYSSQEAEAKKAAAGLWTGEAERPTAYRAKLWDEAIKAAPEGCPIKAVSVSGTKIYLLPWSTGYKKAAVKTAKGERWFCSESDAASAGYRADRT
jgi:endonuclease YncB( thermonuclease family)